MPSFDRRKSMRAIEAETFSGFGGLRQIELPKPQPAKGRVLVRVTAAGVTPLDYTILSGGHPRAKAPLVLGNEGARVIEDAGDSGLAVGSRVMFTGAYGVRENGTWQEWLLTRPEDLAFVSDAIDDVVAASLPVAYLTAQVSQSLCNPPLVVTRASVPDDSNRIRGGYNSLTLGIENGGITYVARARGGAPGLYATYAGMSATNSLFQL
jgi:hypothetical protein